MRRDEGEGRGGGEENVCFVKRCVCVLSHFTADFPRLPLNITH